ncbi:MAG: protein phosphatase 2C domain-containing protein [Microgenomates group bacterium]
MKPIKALIYQENNIKYPYKPQEDSFLSKDNIFAVTDGITHDKGEGGLYPTPSDSKEVAQLVAKELVNNLIAKKDHNEKTIKEAFVAANKKVKTFNSKSKMWANKGKTVYDIGACTASLVILKEKSVLYGILDDCSAAVFDENLEDKIQIRDYVVESAKYFNQHYDWSNPKDRKVWRKEIRNHKFKTKNGEEIGYGALDGREGFINFLQTGEVKATKSDLVCIYSDGFFKAINDLNFIKLIKDSNFDGSLYERINRYLRNKGLDKEKTAYFIKLNT